LGISCCERQLIADAFATVGFVAWLCLLWIAAAAIDLSDGYRAPADRLRDALVVLVGGSFILGLLGALHAALLVALPIVISIAAFAARRDRLTCFRNLFKAPPFESWLPQLMTTCVLAWPGLVRPVLDGDSMSYHLPNAAAWATAHSVWTATTTYWWYPPGSELLASAVLLVGGPRYLGVVGFAVVLLLGLRLSETFRQFGCPTLHASIISVAITTVPVIAQQTGSLQNDVWLAAWLLEGVVITRRVVSSACVWAVASMSKPVGCVFTIASQAVTRTPIKTIALSLSPLAVWLARDAVLHRTAPGSGISESASELWRSTVIAHGGAGASVLVAAVVHQGPGLVTLFALTLASPFIAPQATLRVLPMAYGLLFLFEPFGYANDLPQLATGASLRYALPALVLGSLSLCALLRRSPTIVAVCAAALVVIDVHAYLAIFWNDANVRGVFIAGGVVAITGFVPRKTRLAYCVASMTGLLCFAIRLDSSPQRYDDATIERFGLTSHVFDWVAASQPSKIVAWETDGGLFSTVSPKSVVLDADLLNPCSQARRQNALLAVTVEHVEGLIRGRQLFAEARRCGLTVYEDDGALVVDPARSVNTVPRTLF